jgi:(2Fe-2S) ferredoxin
MPFYRSHVLVSVDPECLKRGAHEVIDAIHDELVAQGLIDEVQVLETSRIGDPATYGPDLIVYPEGIHYGSLCPDDIPFLVEEHFLKGRVVERFRARQVTVADEELGPPKAKEVRNVLRNCGKIDPTNIEEYIAEDGYQAVAKVVTEMTPEQVIEQVMASGLRGRGGAGFLAAKKWQLCRGNPGDIKYTICNADEGDPGAFMNRRVLESDPHSVVEGMTIAAYAIGSRQGYIYCRAEYPLAVERLNIAIAQARELGLLGQNILGSDFSFDLEVRMGAGAFVCGEETALMASIEGRRGEPHPPPPHPPAPGVGGTTPHKKKAPGKVCDGTACMCGMSTRMGCVCVCVAIAIRGPTWMCV